MLKLSDFLILPQVDALVKKMVSDVPGITLLAGIDARHTSISSIENFRSSGLSAIFNILIQEILLANPQTSATVIAEDRSLARVPRQFSRRVRFVRADPTISSIGEIELARMDRTALLVIDHLTEEIIPVVMNAGASGMRVLTQFNTVMRGSSVVRQLVELAACRRRQDYHNNSSQTGSKRTLIVAKPV